MFPLLGRLAVIIISIATTIRSDAIELDFDYPQYSEDYYGQYEQDPWVPWQAPSTNETNATCIVKIAWWHFYGTCLLHSNNLVNRTCHPSHGTDRFGRGNCSAAGGHTCCIPYNKPPSVELPINTTTTEASTTTETTTVSTVASETTTTAESTTDTAATTETSTETTTDTSATTEASTEATTDTTATTEASTETTTDTTATTEASTEATTDTTATTETSTEATTDTSAPVVAFQSVKKRKPDA